MSEIEEHKISFSLEVNVDEALTNIRKVQTILYRTIGLLRRIGLPPEIDAAVARIQQLIALLNMLRLTIIALATASGPYGWALAGLSAISFIVSVDDFVFGAGA